MSDPYEPQDPYDFAPDPTGRGNEKFLNLLKTSSYVIPAGGALIGAARLGRAAAGLALGRSAGGVGKVSSKAPDFFIPGRWNAVKEGFKRDIRGIASGMPIRNPVGGVMAGMGTAIAADYFIFHSEDGIFGDTYAEGEEIKQQKIERLERRQQERDQGFPRSNERISYGSTSFSVDDNFNEVEPSPDDWDRNAVIPQYQQQAKWELRYHNNREEIDSMTPEGQNWWQSQDLYQSWLEQKQKFAQAGIDPSDPYYTRQIYASNRYDPDGPLDWTARYQPPQRASDAQADARRR